MRTLVHLSDLHFGADDPLVADAVKRSVTELQPHVVVVSGDLTQRARPAEFRAARRFLDSLPGEKVVVPGNHDVPLWNVIRRFLMPLTRYRRLITRELSPTYYDDEVAIVGINTARSWTRKSGRINAEQAAEASGYLRSAAARALKLVVTHHPFDLSETQGERKVVGRAQMALERLAHAGAEVLLAGHFHEASTIGTAKRYPLPGGYSALVVQAGTALSVRTRRSTNSFNVLRIDPPRLTIEILSWDPAAQAFTLREQKHYEQRAGAGMVRLDA
jgi:3',5'-cyclic AMP phosphodiesterase CpdA